MRWTSPWWACLNLSGYGQVTSSANDLLAVNAVHEVDVLMVSVLEPKWVWAGN